MKSPVARSCHHKTKKCQGEKCQGEKCQGDIHNSCLTTPAEPGPRPFSSIALRTEEQEISQHCTPMTADYR
jgi:hypothetical protein